MLGRRVVVHHADVKQEVVGTIVDNFPAYFTPDYDLVVKYFGTNAHPLLFEAHAYDRVVVKLNYGHRLVTVTPSYTPFSTVQ